MHFILKAHSLFTLLCLFSNGSHASISFNDWPESERWTSEHKIEFILYSSSNPNSQELLNFIEGAYIDIFSTTLGQAICQANLHANSHFISKHLGVRVEAANQIVQICNTQNPTHSLTNSQDSWVFPSRPEELSKFTLTPDFAQRTYQFIINETLHTPIEAWTEPLTNTTTIVLDSPSISADDLRIFLIQTLTHELAVYFDSKSFANDEDWMALSRQDPQAKFMFDEYTNKTLLTPHQINALNNPLIHQALTSIRAFYVEYEIVKEFLEKQTSLNSHVSLQILYPEEQFPYLYTECDAACIEIEIFKFIDLFRPWSLELSAFLPNYLAKKQVLAMSEYGVFSKNHQNILRAQQSVFRFREKYPRHQPILNTFFTLPLRESKYFSDQLFEPLLKKDIESLHTLDPQFYLFITQPRLSGKNVNISFGPRPRMFGGEI